MCSGGGGGGGGGGGVGWGMWSGGGGGGGRPSPTARRKSANHSPSWLGMAGMMGGMMQYHPWLWKWLPKDAMRMSFFNSVTLRTLCSFIWRKTATS